jgi:hypothetical protein
MLATQDRRAFNPPTTFWPTIPDHVPTEPMTNGAHGAGQPVAPAAPPGVLGLADADLDPDPDAAVAFAAAEDDAAFVVGTAAFGAALPAGVAAPAADPAVLPPDTPPATGAASPLDAAGAAPTGVSPGALPAGDVAAAAVAPVGPNPAASRISARETLLPQPADAATTTAANTAPHSWRQPAALIPTALPVRGGGLRRHSGRPPTP